MPRPGPRPYECVRRAWHSERHQPMRGLIIQQILRLVHENHSATTKKNREWQEKLPVVVFKAEEIMYSKANSEAEYSNAETLWDRVNDAVDTIIRRDESTEVGGLLPPCVEAALNLGCVPVRASRSQRLNNPRTYLRPAYQECSHISQGFINDNAMQDSSNLMPLRTSNDSIPRPPNVGSPCLVWEGNTHVMPNANRHIDSPSEKFNRYIDSPSEKFHLVGDSNNVEMEDNTSLNRASVYPLYYGMSIRPEVRPLGQELLKSGPIIVGVPVYSSAEPAESGCLQNLFPGSLERSPAEETCKANTTENKGKQPHTDFDLSLRLGLFPNSNSSREKSSSCATEGVADKLFHNKGQSKEELPFFPVKPAYARSWLHMSEGGNLGVDLVSRKRKLPFNADVENEQIFWSQDSTSLHFAGQRRNRGL